jgi:hypothetical protein
MLVCIALGVCVLRLHAVSALFVALAATFPIRAAQKLVPQPQATSVDPVHAAVALPDFVPVINYDQFLLASRGDEFGETDGISSETRTAAEALSAKFAGPSAKSSSEMFRAVVQRDPIAPSLLDAPEDPKLQMQAATDLSDTSDANDPAKAAERAEAVERAPPEARSTSAVRMRHVHARRRAVAARSSQPNHSILRRKRSRVASAESTSQRSGSAYNGIGADLQRLIGFGSLTPDNRLTN